MKLDWLWSILSWAWLFQLLYGFGDLISPAGVPRIHLRYRKGRCFEIRGSLPGWARSEIESALKEWGVSHAAIKQMKDGKFQFSRSVPEELRQKLRNLIVAR